MINHRTSAALITWGGIVLFLSAFIILFSCMGILTESGRYDDASMEVAFFYIGVLVAVGGVSMLLGGVHRVVSSLGTPPEQDLPSQDESVSDERTSDIVTG